VLKITPMVGPYPPFWRFLGEWLGTRGWTQVKLADELGVHQTVVSKWLHTDPRRRTRPGRRAVAGLVRILGIPLPELLGMLLADETEAERLRAVGQLTAPVTVDDDDDLIGDMIRARTEEMREAVHDTPRAFWATIINATLDAAIGGARNMARLLVEAESAPGPVSSQADAEVRSTDRPPNKAHTGPEDPLVNLKLGAPRVVRTALLPAGMSL
jgi:transcriptional regulator with XRE-family HTH domain